MIRLVAEVLDKQVVDANGDNAGRVDGMILEVRDGAPPRLVAIEISPITLLARFSRRLAAWYAKRDARLGPGRGTPYRVPWESVQRSKLSVTLDRSADDTPIIAMEDWLRVTIIERLPGS
jgi:sporulation protein YlmC with PRC-barrel domain